MTRVTPMSYFTEGEACEECEVGDSGAPRVLRTTLVAARVLARRVQDSPGGKSRGPSGLLPTHARPRRPTPTARARALARARAR